MPTRGDCRIFPIRPPGHHGEFKSFHAVSSTTYVFTHPKAVDTPVTVKPEGTLMATTAQIEANRRNSHFSTGPRTLEGKARAAANSISFGLFTTRDFVAPGQEAEYAQFVDAWRKHLQASGPAEETFAIEITRAAWRLRRCALVESNLADHDRAAAEINAEQLDPMLDPETRLFQLSVDRAHTSAQNKLRRTIVELRRIQTERHYREYVIPENMDPALGLADFRSLDKSFDEKERAGKRNSSFEDLIDAAVGQPIVPGSENWLRFAENQNEPDSEMPDGATI
jgi:hypothetical protein